jgi:hypothetical protein
MPSHIRNDRAVSAPMPIEKVQKRRCRRHDHDDSQTPKRGSQTKTTDGRTTGGELSLIMGSPSSNGIYVVMTRPTLSRRL